MTIFLVTNDQFNYELNGENVAMEYINVYSSFYDARRSLNSYTKWKEYPKLHRRVVPNHVVKTLMSRERLENNCIIATYKGVNQRGSEVWFSISFVKM